MFIFGLIIQLCLYEFNLKPGVFEYFTALGLKLAVKTQAVDQEIATGTWRIGHQHTAIGLKYLFAHGVFIYTDNGIY